MEWSLASRSAKRCSLSEEENERRRLAAEQEVGGLMGAWPCVAGAQQLGRIPTIGFLGPTAPDTRAAWSKDYFRKRSGSLAIFAAIRRASSFVSPLGDMV